jgi:hypothetical protein
MISPLAASGIAVGEPGPGSLPPADVFARTSANSTERAVRE